MSNTLITNGTTLLIITTWLAIRIRLYSRPWIISLIIVPWNPILDRRSSLRIFKPTIRLEIESLLRYITTKLTYMARSVIKIPALNLGRRDRNTKRLRRYIERILVVLILLTSI